MCLIISHLFAVGVTYLGLSHSVWPEKLASKTLIGLRTKRGPISASAPSSSTIWKLRNQMRSSATLKVNTWSKKGWLRGWWLGTPNICGALSHTSYVTHQ